MYDYSPNLNVFKAIAMAGGFTPRADKGDYVIMRTNGNDVQEFDAHDDTTVLPGDSIRVDERFF